MEFDRSYFASKTAIVTGGASGIGLAIIEELLESNAEKVVIADFNKENLCAHETRLGAQYPGRLKGIFCNVTQEDSVTAMVSSALVFFGGRIDLLFNNAGAGFAGCFTEPSDIAAMGDRRDLISRLSISQTNDDWEKAFALNFYGPLYGMRAVIPVMQKQGGGQIVNTISGIAFYPMAYQSMYSATKAALNAMTLSLRYEYWEDNIKISSATPGTTATSIFGDAPPDYAQSPHQSAQRILNGVANNVRLIYGDDADVAGSRSCFNADCPEIPDKYLLDNARARRKGNQAL